MNSNLCNLVRYNILSCLTIILLFAPTYANAIFKCQVRGGEIKYSNHLLDNAVCTRIKSIKNSTVGINASHLQRAPKDDDSDVVRMRVFTFIYKGTRQYVTRRPEGISARVATLDLYILRGCYLCTVPKDFKVASLSLDTQSFRSEIEDASIHYGVDSALVRAVIHAESAFRPDAISKVGAQGLMQLMPATALRFAVDDPFDPRQNIRGGVRYLAWLLKRFHGNQTLALAGYNAGESTVIEYNGVPPYTETRTYVMVVQSLTERYRSYR